MMQGFTMHNYTKKEYFGNRSISKYDDYYVITPTTYEHNIPISCPVCNYLMRTKDDEIAWWKYKCCNFCSMRWAASRENDWLSGWRPNKEELSTEISQRPFITIQLDIETDT